MDHYIAQLVDLTNTDANDLEGIGIEEARAVVLTGDGRYFSAGTDLSARSGGYDADSTGFKPLRGGTRDVGGELALRIFASTKPVFTPRSATAPTQYVAPPAPRSGAARRR